MEKIIDGEGRAGTVHVTVNPGICGFTCLIVAFKDGKNTVRFDIESGCEQIQKLAGELGILSMKDLFLPLSRNPIFRCAEKSHCHLACPIPCSLVKAMEVALGFALPKDVTLEFEASG